MTTSHDFNPHPMLTLPDKNGKYGRLSGLEAGRMGFLPAKVFVDGVETPDCVLFDDYEGWADVYDRVNGQVVLSETGDGPKVKRLYGRIRYEPKPTLISTAKLRVGDGE